MKGYLKKYIYIFLLVNQMTHLCLDLCGNGFLHLIEHPPHAIQRRVQVIRRPLLLVTPMALQMALNTTDN